MTEEDFDPSLNWLPFGTQEAMEAEARFGRVAALAIALWGRTRDHLERQLLSRYPEVPSGFDLADFQKLHQSAQRMSTALRDPKSAWFSLNSRNSAPAILVGTQRFTAWEARCEIARRAIEYLEKL
jgi:hypothetical protein